MVIEIGNNLASVLVAIAAVVIFWILMSAR